MSVFEEGDISGGAILTGMKGSKRTCLTLQSFQLRTSETASLCPEKESDIQD